MYKFQVDRVLKGKLEQKNIEVGIAHKLQLQTNDDPNVVVGIVKDHGVYELFYKNYNR